MAVRIIVPDKPYRLGRHRSEQEENLRKEGLTTMTDEELDKCKHLEKRSRFDRSFFDKSELSNVK